MSTPFVSAVLKHSLLAATLTTMSIWSVLMLPVSGMAQSAGSQDANSQSADSPVITSFVDGYGEITYMKDRLIIGYRDGVQSRSRAALATSFQAQPIADLELIRGELWELPIDATNVESRMQEIARDPAVEFVQPDIVYHLPAVERRVDSDVSGQGGVPGDSGRGMSPGDSMQGSLGQESMDNILPQSKPSPSDRPSLIRPGLMQPGLNVGTINPQHALQNEGLQAIFPNDSQFSVLWGLRNFGQSGGTPGADISATDAWEVTTGSDDVIIAILDSGVDYNHVDLNANMWQDANGNYGYDFVDNDSNPMDTDGHGTHVAGTVAAVGNNGTGVTGVMWNAKIMAVRVCGSFGCPQSAITQGLSYAISNGAKISNNSYGSSPTSSGPPPGYTSALQNALNNDHLFVVASGNDNNDNDVLNVYPANMMEYFDNVISVGNSTRFDTRSSGSNYGSETVHFFAPGTDIRSTTPGNSYSTFTGTSMAAPHVAGAAGLLKAAYPNAGYDDLKQWLMDGVDTPSGFNNRAITNGRINLFNSISSQNAIISVSPGELSWMLDAGETASGTISIDNNGLNALDVSVTDVNASATSTGFTTEEGFTTGSIHEQAGWTAALGERGSSVLQPHTPLSPIVDDDFASVGSQSLYLPNVPTQINNKIFYAFSPVFDLGNDGSLAANVVEMDFRISSTGGADYGFSLVDGTTGSFLATFVWNYEGNLVFSNGGSDLIVGNWTASPEWQSVKVAYTPGGSTGGSLVVHINQQQVYDGAAPAGNQGDFSQVAIFSDNWHAGETGHFDNVRVYRDGGTPGWLSYNAPSAPIPGGGSATVNVSVDAGSLSGGNFQRTLRIASNDFSNPIVDVLLTLEVMQDLRDYAFTIKVSDALPNDIELTIGSAPDATLAYNELYDRLAPPPPPDGAFDGRLVVNNTSYFEKILPTLTDGAQLSTGAHHAARAHNTTGAQHSTDAQLSADGPSNQWELRFRPSTGNSPITLTWNPALLPQDDTQFRLTDVVGGIFVDLDMRSTGELVVDQAFIDKLYLTHTLGGAQTVVQTYGDKWNIVSLPVQQAHDQYSEIFPETLSESLYGYSGSYVQQSTLTPGNGYWLNFTSADTITFEGDAVNELVIPINPNWNLIGGLTSMATISDPDALVVPGSVYSFNGSYVPVTELEPGLGFWVASTGSGSITLQPATGAPAMATTDSESADGASIAHFEYHPVWEHLDRSLYHRISFEMIQDGETANASGAEATSGEHSSGTVRTLFFGGDVATPSSGLGNNLHPLMITLPPVPPAGSFDARFDESRWIAEGSTAMIHLQQAGMTRVVLDAPETVDTNSPLANGNQHVLSYQYEIVFGDDAGTELDRVSLWSGEEVMIPEGAETIQVQVSASEIEDGAIVSELPKQVSLLQNYPNPFNPTTSIRFELPSDQTVTLSVFDLSGRKVATIASGVYYAGSHEVRFDASSFSSGVYFYQLQTETATLTRKFTLLK